MQVAEVKCYPDDYEIKVENGKLYVINPGSGEWVLMIDLEDL